MKKFVVFLVLLSLCFFAFADYYIESASIDVTVGKNAVHGIEENYVFNYRTPQHGFYRYIPVDYSYLDNPVHAKIGKVSCSDTCSVSTEDGWYVMQIGSSSKQIEGLKDYSISYTYDLGADKNSGYDEFYLNLWGSDWEVPAVELNFSVYVPASSSDYSVWITRGRYGSTDSVEFYVKETEQGSVITGTCSALHSGEAVTIRVQLPEGFYQGARQPWDYRGVMRAAALIVSSILLVLSAFVWVTEGRDPVPIISAKFNSPENMSPMAVGYLVDGSVDDRDITSMLFYWADKGYIEIEEPSKNKFVFIHKKNIPASSSKAEQTLFYGLFNCSKTDSVTLKQLQNGNFYEKMQTAKVQQVAYFRKDRALTSKKCNLLSGLFTLLSMVPVILHCCAVGLYEFAPDDVFGLFVLGLLFTAVFNVALAGLFRKWYVRKSNTLFVLILCALSVLYISSGVGLASLFSDISPVLSGYCLLCGVLISFFARIIPKRSEYGRKLFEDVLGFREFIEKVSMSELVMMIDKDPQYYYHVLSYAIALGLEDKWAKKFEVVGTPAPQWYRGVSPMDIYFCSKLSSNMRTAFKEAAVPAQVKNSGHVGGVGGGFNIGGFAGGGFGGGGGRAW